LGRSLCYSYCSQIGATGRHDGLIL
jgi:hypothetical protein